MADEILDSSLDGVAVIGMSGRFPGAQDLKQFWASRKELSSCQKCLL